MERERERGASALDVFASSEVSGSSFKCVSKVSDSGSS